MFLIFFSCTSGSFLPQLICSDLSRTYVWPLTSLCWPQTDSKHQCLLQIDLNLLCQLMELICPPASTHWWICNMSSTPSIRRRTFSDTGNSLHPPDSADLPPSVSTPHEWKPSSSSFTGHWGTWRDFQSNISHTEAGAQVVFLIFTAWITQLHIHPSGDQRPVGYLVKVHLLVLCSCCNLHWVTLILLCSL